MNRALSVVLLVTIIVPTCAYSATLRCKNGLVIQGDSKFEVSKKCGEPASKETKTSYVEHPGRVDKKITEEWTFNFGPYEFIQTVIFEDGTVVDVKTRGYGF